MLNKKNNFILENDLKFINSKVKNKPFFKNKIILITGSNGFIGHYLSKYFETFQSELKIKKIILIDNSFKNKNSNNNRIVKKNVNVINYNFNLLKPDIIFHLASIASPVYYRKYPIETCHVNTAATENILKYISSYGKKKYFMFFSTSEVYGNPDAKNIPTKESYNGNVPFVGPRACYDESKRYAETLCYLYAKKYDINIKVVRPFNHFGPGLKLNDGRVPADFANSILHKRDIKVFSNGSPKRTFCYISNGIIAYLNLISKKKYDIYNVGDDKNEISIKSLAKKYILISKKLTNFSPKIIFKKNKDKNYLIHVPVRRCPELSKLRKEINYKIYVDLDEGIKRYIQYNLI